MQDDPTYEYVTGYGWMPKAVPDTYVCTYVDYEGKAWQVLDRAPVVGEIWTTVWYYETIHEMLNWFIVKKTGISKIGSWSVDDTLDDHESQHLVTFLPV